MACVAAQAAIGRRRSGVSGIIEGVPTGARRAPARAAPGARPCKAVEASGRELVDEYRMPGARARGVVVVGVEVGAAEGVR